MGMPIYTVGDNASSLSGTVYSMNDEGALALADLTGASVEVHVRKPSGIVVSVAADVVPIDPENVEGTKGRWLYDWTDPTLDEIDEPGIWLVEGEVTYAGGKQQTFGESGFRVRPQFA